MDSGREGGQGWRASYRRAVSILVLMDSGREGAYGSPGNFGKHSFNPCFNGFWARSFIVIGLNYNYNSFNPCFNGFWARSFLRLSASSVVAWFQSLF